MLAVQVSWVGACAWHFLGSRTCPLQGGATLEPYALQGVWAHFASHAPLYYLDHICFPSHHGLILHDACFPDVHVMLWRCVWCAVSYTHLTLPTTPYV